MLLLLMYQVQEPVQAQMAGVMVVQAARLSQVVPLLVAQCQWYMWNL